MRRISLCLLLLTAACAPVRAQVAPAPAAGSIAATYRAAADSLIDAALRDSAAYDRTALLVDRFGHRFSGSQSLEDAIDWILEEMRRDGLENVRGEPVMVPHWVRGEESAELVAPRREPLPMLGLGGSIG
ncbi:MAG: peptidase M28 family protein, partial [Gemmatimonadota bacterium]|nr:peptidase M28 family protein [Gemmatimonadota bacterium]